MSTDLEQRVAALEVCVQLLEAALGRLLKPHWPRERTDFMADTRTDSYDSGIVITHLPTGVKGGGLTRDEAVSDLARELLTRGRVNVNDVRAALGLPELEDAPDHVAEAWAARERK